MSSKEECTLCKRKWNIEQGREIKLEHLEHPTRFICYDCLLNESVINELLWAFNRAASIAADVWGLKDKAPLPIELTSRGLTKQKLADFMKENYKN